MKDDNVVQIHSELHRKLRLFGRDRRKITPLMFMLLEMLDEQNNSWLPLEFLLSELQVKKNVLTEMGRSLMEADLLDAFAFDDQVLSATINRDYARLVTVESVAMA
jgi:hypothetical protein